MDTKMEQWKKIEDFEDYLIYSSGKIFSLKSNKYLKLSIHRQGYYWVSLCKSGKRYCKFISRLVAQAFIPNPDNKPQVNHKDGNKANNHYTNLEWVTNSENQLHAFANGLKKYSSDLDPNRIPVNVYDCVTGKFKSTHVSLNCAARFYSLDRRIIGAVLAGRQKQTHGLIFSKV